VICIPSAAFLNSAAVLHARTHTHTVYLWASIITVNISLYSINRFTLPVVAQYVFRAVGTKFSSSSQMTMRLQMVCPMCHT